MAKGRVSLFWGGLLALAPVLAPGAAKRVPLSPEHFIIGEGWAPLGSDPGSARELAKTRALGDLALNARVTVRTAVTDVLGQKAGETLREVESKVETNAVLAPMRIDHEEFILHSPRTGQITCRLAVRKSQYDEDIRRDLSLKKERVMADLASAERARNRGSIAEAMERYKSALAGLDRDFPNLPVALARNGQPDTARNLAMRELNSLIGSMEVRCSPTIVIYDDNGRYDGDVAATILWTGKSQARLGAVTLTAAWDHRPSAPAASAVTDPSGRARFRPRVDLFYNQAALIVLPESGSGSACRVNFFRRKAILVAVRSNSAERNQLLEKRIREELSSSPIDVVDQDGSSSADGLKLIVTEKTTTTRHPDGGLYRSDLQTRIDLQSPSGSPLASCHGPSQVGYGANPLSAESDSRARALDDLLTLTKKIVREHAYQRPLD